MRLKANNLDLTLTVGYPPPVGSKGDERRMAAKAAKLTAQWLISCIDTAPCRSTPFLLGDLQQRFGLSDGIRWEGHGEYHLQAKGKLEYDSVWEDFSAG